MRSALIGYTGFVGSNLARQRPFDDLYNSKNIEAIMGRAYDLIVCAGAPAEKWKANQNPDADRAAIGKLTQALAGVRTRQFVLISTVDVYPTPIDVDEDSAPDWTKGSAYGRHRRLLEEFVIARFPALIARLPGLFGTGLKKNIIYDFLHGNQVDKVHADARFQFYGLDRLWDDLQKAQYARLAVWNAATEPVSVAEVARDGFGASFQNRPAETPPARYDMHTRYAALWGKTGRYLLDKASVLKEIQTFVRQEKAKA